MSALLVVGVDDATGRSAEVTEEGRETLARAMFERQAASYELDGLTDLAWEDSEIRKFWRSEADHVVSVLGLE